MTGQLTISTRQERRVRSRAMDVMERYVERVRTAQVIDVSEFYGGFAKDGLWRLNGVEHAPSEVSDPLSRNLSEELGEPDVLPATAMAPMRSG